MKKKLTNLAVTCVVCIFFLMAGTGSIFAESVYVVNHSSQVFSFDVVNDQFEFRNQISLTAYGYGGIDLAIDNEYDILFMSSENTDIFEILDAKELSHIKSFDLDGAWDITGIVYDGINSRILGTSRNTNDLYIIAWDPAAQNLTLDETVQLSNISHACDLAINGDTLYVSEYQYGIGGSAPTSKKVYAYDMSDDFAFIETVDMQDYLITIDYNPTDDSLYGGCWMARGSETNHHIIKRTFDPNNLTTIEDLGFNVVGIATNHSEAGRVFATTLGSGYSSAVQLWDTTGYDPNDFEFLDKYDNTNTDGVSLYGLAGLIVGDDYIEPHIDLTKSHDANSCVSPGDTFTYTICWDNDTDETATDVTLIDYLPDGVDYNWLISMSPPTIDGNYVDTNTGRYYIWELDDIGPGDANCVELTVTVNAKAEPGMWLENKAVLTSSLGNTVVDINEPNVCCWDTGSIIYVDEMAYGNNNGTNWDDAYTDLQRALRRASFTACISGPNTIYVAQGTYNPGFDPEVSFKLIDGMSVYGGFPTGGDTFSNRNPEQYKTILTGDNGSMWNKTVVTMGDDSLLDGFSVTRAAFPGYGIYGNGADFTIENCTVKDNDQYGVYALDGDITVKWCSIKQNKEDGIYHEGESYELIIENSWIMRNRQYGVYCFKSTPTIKNSIVSESDLAKEGLEGIRIINPTYPPVLYNNTISNNKGAGVSFTDNETITDPNDRDWPDIQNCIIYYNNDGGDQLVNLNPDAVAQYSCIQDCNEIPGTTTNYNDKPEFAYTVDPNGTPDPNNYHLTYDSFCKDKGSSLLTYTDQVDIDGEGTDRKYGTHVDIGADEIYSCDEPLTEDNISNDLDWNADGVVNLYEFSFFQRAWLSHDPNDDEWLADPNLADPNLSEGWYEWKYQCNLDGTEDTNTEFQVDLDVFWDEWLWEACWRDNYIAMYGMMSGGGENIMMAPPMMSAVSLESSIIEEEMTYADMPISKLAPLVIGIHDIIGYLEISIAEDHENAENLTEARDFLEDILTDIKASKQ